MVSRRLKLILGIIIPIFGFFFMSHNTFAINLSTSSLDLNYNLSSGGDYLWRTGMLYGINYGQSFVNMNSGARWYQFNTPNISPAGNSAVIHGETNIVISNSTRYGADLDNFVNLPYIQVGACAMGGRTLTIKASSVSTALTFWTSGNTYRWTLTVYFDVAVDGLPSSGSLVCMIGNSSYQFFTHIADTNTTLYFEQNPMSIEYSSNINDLLLQTQINQNNTIINQNQAVIDQNNSAYNSISNQDAGDISGATNSQTSSIIGVISSFVTSLSSINATSCDLSLPFPEFLGGDTVVTPCSGKEKAPALITIGSSMLLIGVFIPLAWIVLRMIYNEIRSWTNG